jgi:hypothetical protein
MPQHFCRFRNINMVGNAINNRQSHAAKAKLRTLYAGFANISEYHVIFLAVA